MPDHDADIAVIGAGILGLSTAMALATTHEGLRVVSLEQESGVGRHQSGNNSGVIHSGLYYRPGSAKARMAVAGAERMYAFCDEHGIGAERCGKVVVATHESELERMRELHRRGDANGVPGIRELGPGELHEFEPNAAGVRALHIPSTGIADYRGVCDRYRELLESAGGSVRLRSRVGGVRIDPDGVQLQTSTGVVRARYAVNCAGLQADRIARRAGASEARDLRIVPFRGEYYDLVPSARHMLKNLIYPVPDPAFPFLGVHFTRRLDGSVEAGPNAVLALKREGYRWRDISAPRRRRVALLARLPPPRPRPLANRPRRSLAQRQQVRLRQRPPTPHAQPRTRPTRPRRSRSPSPGPPPRRLPGRRLRDRASGPDDPRIERPQPRRNGEPADRRGDRINGRIDLVGRLI